jgi:hypothetical protein
MNALTTRDKWLAAALPALVTLLGGWIFVTRPATRELASLRQRVENQGPLIARQALVAGAQADRADLEKVIAEKRTESTEHEGVFDRNWALQQVSRLCAAHGLSLNATAPEPGGKLPPALQEASTAYLRVPNAAPPQVWRIELSGSYPGVLKLLEGLQNSKPLIVPLNLSMQADKNERKPATWVLTLWL